jgi:hypothetical protein
MALLLVITGWYGGQLIYQLDSGENRGGSDSKRNFVPQWIFFGGL